MKFTKLFVALCAMALLFSCSKDDKGVEKQPTGKTKKIETFEAGGKTYTLTLLEPTKPKYGMDGAGVNEIVISLKMDGKNVNNYEILIDPRMPSMGNHGSPDNKNLEQGKDGLYYGKINFTMTGYWRINLQIKNADGEIIAGEEVPPMKMGNHNHSGDHKNMKETGSSVYLALEF